MRILGIDPGTASTGWGIIEIDNAKLKNPEFKLIAYNVIKTEANSYMPKRLEKIYKEIKYLINRYKPHKMALESLFFFKNQRTVMSVSQSRGVVMLAAQRCNLDIIEQAPLQVKSSICQNGRADKKELQNSVKNILKLKEVPKPDDSADSLTSSICYTKNIMGIINVSKKSKIIKKNELLRSKLRSIPSGKFLSNHSSP